MQTTRVATARDDRLIRETRMVADEFVREFGLDFFFANAGLGEFQHAPKSRARDLAGVPDERDFGVGLDRAREVELKVDVDAAAQSFADRNGRGTKKNANLVATYDTSSALSKLRNAAIKGTVFEDRVADGRSTGATLTAVQNIVDASTLEQMLLNVISHGNRKREQLKHHHIPAVLPYCQEFLQLLEKQFGDSWRDTKQPDTYRRLYVHGWAFALKALALAYNQVRRDKLGPIMEVMVQEQTTDHDTIEDLEKKFTEAVAEITPPIPTVSFDQLRQRLSAIDWRRDRRHWIQITGFLQDKSGTKKTVKLKTTGEVVVAAAASNTPAHISQVENKILSETWEELTQHESEPLS